MLLIRTLTLHIGALACMLLAAFGAGHLLTRRLAFANRLERVVFTTTLGLGLCAIALLGLALTGMLYRGLLVAVTIAAAGSVLAIFSRRGWRLIVRSGLVQPRRYPAVALIVATLVAQYWCLSFATAQYPPILWDSTAYHLTLARTYLDAHSLTVQPGLVFPVVPALNHLLFSWGMAMGGDALAPLLEHAFLTLAALGLVAWGLRRDAPALGFTAAALWMCHPLVAMLGAAAYVDVAAACYAFLGLYALRVCFDLSTTSRSTWWLMAAALLAMSAGVKSPGVVLLGLASLLSLVVVARGQLSRRAWLGGLAVAGAVGLPWYLVVWAHAGNPLWPASAAMTSGVWESSARAFWPVWGHVGLPKTLDNLLWMPIHLVERPAAFLPDNNRLLLPVVAALPITWFVAIFDRTTRWWTGWTMAFLVIWFASSQQMRFLVTAMPMAALAIVSSIAWLFGRVAVVRRASWIGLTVYALVVGTAYLLADLRVKEWPPATPASRAQFLRNTVHGYTAAEYLNAHVAPGEAVGIINASWVAYHVNARVIDIAASLLQVLGRPVLRWPDDAAFVERLQAAGVPWLLIGIDGTQPIVTLPSTPLTPGPFVWPGYDVVYVDRDAAVVRRR